MPYTLFIVPSCKKELNKACKNNAQLKHSLTKKIQEICENPSHYKPLRNDLCGLRRVHILKSFVLIFNVDENEKSVTLVSFSHHDTAYSR
ncbi:MAG: type II toxin-antitoxin system RelE/ParE family toxin [Methanosarcina sp.]|uniref:type II toxin-antitoxin system RelE family toxin n=1 Tax=Methanosarcina sp. TaxID=2213 RepID=UPI00262A01DA|nr:type II toxin-antitoxin system RelE/ParE family toxin [Methanosarcina sp.]MDD3245385.1 type II toxin-antitoxin system RelE/ParE family toxin [Methanosarcina sp.]MDD4247600.1 type II toxin-antitoxin system RelE/ParE family toxin [Methanosarcina sp.]